MMTFSAQGLIGGLLIGAAACLMLWGNGRIAGISGISAQLLDREGRSWRLLFIGGLIAGASLWSWLGGQPLATGAAPSLGLLIASGLLVGYGTRLGAGCTSGHGVCGLARRSRRSLVATLTFMAAGMVTVFVARTLS